MVSFVKRAVLRDRIAELKKDVEAPEVTWAAIEDKPATFPAADLGQPGGPAQLDGSGKLSADELPPLQHDSAEAADESGMLALNVSAPAICIRTDFSPAHVFYLSADPASTLANWHDTGAFSSAAANPTAAVGPTATNGVAATYMRSDASPAMDMTANFAWTGIHGWSEAVTLTGGAINLPAPTNPTDAANKAYVDGAVSALPDAVLVGGNDDAVTLTMGTTVAQNVQIHTNNLPRITVDSIGNVGIGITNPQAPLALAGAMTIDAGTVQFQANPTSGTDTALGNFSSHPLNLVTNNITRFSISADGDLTSQGDLHMSEKKIINLGNPSDPRDAVNLQGLDSRLSAAQRTAIDALTAVTAPDATDLASAQTLANANKGAINDIIAALQAT